ncbi:winged helix-turn-helix transcriptional regulator [Rhizobium leguminosarum]|uniref:winged helix-turn-helix transcriptional regulator n=1 Tax=Rhizobium leguminosarum TaxID=384 RepID=UPI001FD9E20A|nr:helix-turn-helix domain-containing protein [Rhizobium leguminosarum]
MWPGRFAVGHRRQVEAFGALPSPGWPHAISEIRRRVGGISEKVLIQQLRELVAMNVLVRHDHQQVPPVVDYALTPFGETLVQALVPLCEWGNQNRAQVAGTLQRSSKVAGEPS